jgi:hypothetical protein
MVLFCIWGATVNGHYSVLGVSLLSVIALCCCQFLYLVCLCQWLLFCMCGSTLNFCVWCATVNGYLYGVLLSSLCPLPMVIALYMACTIDFRIWCVTANGYYSEYGLPLSVSVNGAPLQGYCSVHGLPPVNFCLWCATAKGYCSAYGVPLLMVAVTLQKRPIQI